MKISQAEIDDFLNDFIDKPPVEQHKLIKSLWEYFSPADKRTIHNIIGQGDIWYPLAGPQMLVCDLAGLVDVIGFGGAAGGGKTDLGIGLALTRHTKTAIFRREAKELIAVEDRLEELLGSREGYNSQKGVWRLGKGRQIGLGSCKDLGDEQKHQGRPKDFLLIDEATNFLESQVRFLMGWVRTTDPKQHCLTLITFNPPQDSDGEWVISYFSPWLDPKHMVPAEPGEIRYFVMLKGKEMEWPNPKPFTFEGETIRPQSRTFVPSRIKDNPYLYNTGYMTQLQALPEPLRSQMLYGDFQAGRGEDPYRVCPTAWVDAAMSRWKKRDAKGVMDSVGVDPARGGDNDTAIMTRHAEWFSKCIVHPGKQTPDGPTTAGLVFVEIRDDAPVHIEMDGIGASPYDFLVQKGLQVVGVVSGQPHPVGKDNASKMLGFFTMRSMFWWRMREALDPNNPNPIALPPDDRLKKELTAPRWRMRGLEIYVESRDEVIDRIGFSPDLATACCLANMHTPKMRKYADRAYSQKRGEYNPFEQMRRR